MPKTKEDALLAFCSYYAVQWLQPYFASHPFFFYPEGLQDVC